MVSDRVALQGNYDPRELIEDDEGTKTPETVRRTAREMLESLGPQKLIANLGEGLGGKESPSLVKAFVDAIHEESAAMIIDNEEP
jgi:uroporphyrinogen decarboxylase